MNKERLLNNNIIIRTPTIFEDKTQFKGYDNKTIALNVFHRPEIHIRRYAQVVSVPRVLLKRPMMLAKIYGLPAYEVVMFDSNPPALVQNYGPDPFYYTDQIEMNIQPGDIVYFNYTTLMPPQEKDTLFNHRYMISTTEKHGKESVNYHHFQIDYTDVICIARYEKTEPWMDDFYVEMELERVSESDSLGTLLRQTNGKNLYRRKYYGSSGYVLVRPDRETWEDILVPTYEMIKGEFLLDRFGKKIPKSKDKWIATKPNPEDKELQGFVEIVSPPLKGDTIDIEKGDHVFLREYANAPIRIDNVHYYFTQYPHVIAKSDKKYVPISQLDAEPIVYTNDVDPKLLALMQ